jgi:hypothetical protein
MLNITVSDVSESNGMLKFKGSRQRLNREELLGVGRVGACSCCSCCPSSSIPRSNVFEVELEAAEGVLILLVEGKTNLIFFFASIYFILSFFAFFEVFPNDILI